MELKTLISKIDDIASPVASSLGCEIIELEYVSEGGGWVLRLYIDKTDGGVTLGDCTKLSRAVSSVLEVENIIEGHYNLEVSSPGSPRPVRRLKDFKRFVGSELKIKTYNKVGDRKNFRGILKSVEDEEIEVLDSGSIYKIPLEEIFKARVQN